MNEPTEVLSAAESLRDPWRQGVGARPEHPIVSLLRYLPRHRHYALLTVLFGVLGFLLSFAYPWVIGSVIDLAGQRRDTERARDQLLWLAQLSASVGVLHALVVYGRGHFNVRLGESIICDLRRDLFAHLQALSVRFYTRERTGALLSRVLHDVQDATSLLYMGMLVAVMDMAQLAIALILLVNISPALAFACLLVFPLYAYVFLRMNPLVRASSERVRRQLSGLSGKMQERLAGQALIKTCTAEAREQGAFSQEVASYLECAVEQSHRGHVVSASGELLVHMGTTVVMGYGGYLALSGDLTPGQLTRFLGYVAILYGPVRRLAELNITYQTSLTALRRVLRIFAIRPAIRERTQARCSPPVLGEVRFEDVRFRYQDGSDEARARLDDDARDPALAPTSWVIDGVTLEARPGERVAIIGPSGAGKTTLLSMLPRLYDPSQGRILVDGVDLRDYSLHALRSAIAFVQQDSFLFSGSVRENIGYGRIDASEQDVLAASKAAYAHEFIQRLPQGYETLLGERGVNLSGGQRQRLSIARALLRDPRILILDEATSSLDAESESFVQAALDRLMVGRTCFIIAHRLSTVRNADRIVVLAGGQVVETGSHDQLMARAGTYARLMRKQASEELPEPLA
jgi:ABC-type multidrug transport system fused ATPase/permease subunit